MNLKLVNIINNLYIFQNGKVVDARIIDWQEMKVSPPVLDLVYMLSVTTGEKFRSKHLTEAIDFYYESFSDAMKRLDCDVDVLYPKSVFDEHLKEIQPIGLLIAIVTWPFTMTEEKDVIDLGDYVRNCENSEHYIKFSKVAKDRFINLVKDFARYELI